MEKLIYKKFILGTGAYLDKALAKGLGGVIFFTRDIHSKEQFQALINDIKQKAVYKLFLSIDQEGGRVERTENIHARYLSPRFAYERGEDFLRNQAKKIAQELKDYGINLNFAPCADVNTNPKNPIIGERAFSSITYDVVNAVKIVSETYRQNGIIPCLKHFPGHGDASMDSHLTLPIIDLAMSTMENIHIKPFKENLDAEMIMAAHLHCTCFDKEPIPASLSKNVIGYLRNV
ncbi:glycoside hydrolase family 3 protein, partial [bacterium]|nr:glycoside hydrolase family 3 protein [bacterium]